MDFEFSSEESSLENSWTYVLDEVYPPPINIANRFNRLFQIYNNIAYKAKWRNLARKIVRKKRIKLTKSMCLLTRAYNQISTIHISTFFKKWMLRYKWIKITLRIRQNERQILFTSYLDEIDLEYQLDNFNKWTRITSQVMSNNRKDRFIDAMFGYKDELLLQKYMNIMIESFHIHQAKTEISNTNWENITKKLMHQNIMDLLKKRANRFVCKKIWNRMLSHLIISEVEKAHRKDISKYDWKYFSRKILLQHRIDEFYHSYIQYTWVRYANELKYNVDDQKLDHYRKYKMFKNLKKKILLQYNHNLFIYAKNQYDIAKENYICKLIQRKYLFKWKNKQELHEEASRLLEIVFSEAIADSIVIARQKAARIIQKWYRELKRRPKLLRLFTRWRNPVKRIATEMLVYPDMLLHVEIPLRFTFYQFCRIPNVNRALSSLLPITNANSFRHAVKYASSQVHINDISISLPILQYTQNPGIPKQEPKVRIILDLKNYIPILNGINYSQNTIPPEQTIEIDDFLNVHHFVNVNNEIISSIATIRDEIEKLKNNLIMKIIIKQNLLIGKIIRVPIINCIPKSIPNPHIPQIDLKIQDFYSDMVTFSLSPKMIPKFSDVEIVSNLAGNEIVNGIAILEPDIFVPQITMKEIPIVDLSYIIYHLQFSIIKPPLNLSIFDKFENRCSPILYEDFSVNEIDFKYEFILSKKHLVDFSLQQHFNQEIDIVYIPDLAFELELFENIEVLRNYKPNNYSQLVSLDSIEQNIEIDSNSTLRKINIQALLLYNHERPNFIEFADKVEYNIATYIDLVIGHRSHFLPLLAYSCVALPQPPITYKYDIIFKFNVIYSMDKLNCFERKKYVLIPTISHITIPILAIPIDLRNISRILNNFEQVLFNEEKLLFVENPKIFIPTIPIRIGHLFNLQSNTAPKQMITLDIFDYKPQYEIIIDSLRTNPSIFNYQQTPTIDAQKTVFEISFSYKSIQSYINIDKLLMLRKIEKRNSSLITGSKLDLKIAIPMIELNPIFNLSNIIIPKLYDLPKINIDMRFKFDLHGVFRKIINIQPIHSFSYDIPKIIVLYQFDHPNLIRIPIHSLFNYQTYKIIQRKPTYLDFIEIMDYKADIKSTIKSIISYQRINDRYKNNYQIIANKISCKIQNFSMKFACFDIYRLMEFKPAKYYIKLMDIPPVSYNYMMPKTEISDKIKVVLNIKTITRKQQYKLTDLLPIPVIKEYQFYLILRQNQHLVDTLFRLFKIYKKRVTVHYTHHELPLDYSFSKIQRKLSFMINLKRQEKMCLNNQAQDIFFEIPLAIEIPILDPTKIICAFKQILSERIEHSISNNLYDLSETNFLLLIPNLHINLSPISYPKESYQIEVFLPFNFNIIKRSIINVISNLVFLCKIEYPINNKYDFSLDLDLSLPREIAKKYNTINHLRHDVLFREREESIEEIVPNIILFIPEDIVQTKMKVSQLNNLSLIDKEIFNFRDFITLGTPLRLLPVANLFSLSQSMYNIQPHCISTKIDSIDDYIDRISIPLRVILDSPISRSLEYFISSSINLDVEDMNIAEIKCTIRNLVFINDMIFPLILIQPIVTNIKLEVNERSHQPILIIPNDLNNIYNHVQILDNLSHYQNFQTEKDYPIQPIDLHLKVPDICSLDATPIESLAMNHQQHTNNKIVDIFANLTLDYDFNVIHQRFVSRLSSLSILTPNEKLPDESIIEKSELSLNIVIPELLSRIKSLAHIKSQMPIICETIGYIDCSSELPDIIEWLQNFNLMTNSINYISSFEKVNVEKEIMFDYRIELNFKSITHIALNCLMDLQPKVRSQYNNLFELVAKDILCKFNSLLVDVVIHNVGEYIFSTAISNINRIIESKLAYIIEESISNTVPTNYVQIDLFVDVPSVIAQKMNHFKFYEQSVIPQQSILPEEINIIPNFSKLGLIDFRFLTIYQPKVCFYSETTGNEVLKEINLLINDTLSQSITSIITRDIISRTVESCVGDFDVYLDDLLISILGTMNMCVVFPLIITRQDISNQILALNNFLFLDRTTTNAPEIQRLNIELRMPILRPNFEGLFNLQQRQTYSINQSVENAIKVFEQVLTSTSGLITRSIIHFNVSDLFITPLNIIYTTIEDVIENLIPHVKNLTNLLITSSVSNLMILNPISHHFIDNYVTMKAVQSIVDDCQKSLIHNLYPIVRQQNVIEMCSLDLNLPLYLINKYEIEHSFNYLLHDNSYLSRSAVNRSITLISDFVVQDILKTIRSSVSSDVLHINNFLSDSGILIPSIKDSVEQFLNDFSSNLDTIFDTILHDTLINVGIVFNFHDVQFSLNKQLEFLNMIQVPIIGKVSLDHLIDQCFILPNIEINNISCLYNYEKTFKIDVNEAIDKSHRLIKQSMNQIVKDTTHTIFEQHMFEMMSSFNLIKRPFSVIAPVNILLTELDQNMSKLIKFNLLRPNIYAIESMLFEDKYEDNELINQAIYLALRQISEDGLDKLLKVIIKQDFIPDFIFNDIVCLSSSYDINQHMKYLLSIKPNNVNELKMERSISLAIKQIETEILDVALGDINFHESLTDIVSPKKIIDVKLFDFSIMRHVISLLNFEYITAMELDVEKSICLALQQIEENLWDRFLEDFFLQDSLPYRYDFKDIVKPEIYYININQQLDYLLNYELTIPMTHAVEKSVHLIVQQVENNLFDALLEEMIIKESLPELINFNDVINLDIPNICIERIVNCLEDFVCNDSKILNVETSIKENCCSIDTLLSKSIDLIISDECKRFQEEKSRRMLGINIKNHLLSSLNQIAFSTLTCIDIGSNVSNEAPKIKELAIDKCSEMIDILLMNPIKEILNENIEIPSFSLDLSFPISMLGNCMKRNTQHLSNYIKLLAQNKSGYNNDIIIGSCSFDFNSIIISRLTVLPLLSFCAAKTHSNVAINEVARDLENIFETNVQHCIQCAIINQTTDITNHSIININSEQNLCEDSIQLFMRDLEEFVLNLPLKNTINTILHENYLNGLIEEGVCEFINEFNETFLNSTITYLVLENSQCYNPYIIDFQVSLIHLVTPLNRINTNIKINEEYYFYNQISKIEIVNDYQVKLDIHHLNDFVTKQQSAKQLEYIDNVISRIDSALSSSINIAIAQITHDMCSCVCKISPTSQFIDNELISESVETFLTMINDSLDISIYKIIQMSLLGNLNISNTFPISPLIHFDVNYLINYTKKYIKRSENERLIEINRFLMEKMLDMSLLYSIQTALSSSHNIDLLLLRNNRPIIDDSLLGFMESFSTSLDNILIDELFKIDLSEKSSLIEIDIDMEPLINYVAKPRALLEYKPKLNDFPIHNLIRCFEIISSGLDQSIKGSVSSILKHQSSNFDLEYLFIEDLYMIHKSVDLFTESFEETLTKIVEDNIILNVKSKSNDICVNPDFRNFFNIKNHIETLKEFSKPTIHYDIKSIKTHLEFNLKNISIPGFNIFPNDKSIIISKAITSFLDSVSKELSIPSLFDSPKECINGLTYENFISIIEEIGDNSVEEANNDINNLLDSLLLSLLKRPVNFHLLTTRFYYEEEEDDDDGNFDSEIDIKMDIYVQDFTIEPNSLAYFIHQDRPIQANDQNICIDLSISDIIPQFTMSILPSIKWELSIKRYIKDFTGVLSTQIHQTVRNSIESSFFLQSIDRCQHGISGLLEAINLHVVESTVTNYYVENPFKINMSLTPPKVSISIPNYCCSDFSKVIHQMDQEIIRKINYIPRLKVFRPFINNLKIPLKIDIPKASIPPLSISIPLNHDDLLSYNIVSCLVHYQIKSNQHIMDKSIRIVMNNIEIASCTFSIQPNIESINRMIYRIPFDEQQEIVDSCIKEIISDFDVCLNDNIKKSIHESISFQLMEELDMNFSLLSQITDIFSLRHFDTLEIPHQSHDLNSLFHGDYSISTMLKTKALDHFLACDISHNKIDYDNLYSLSYNLDELKGDISRLFGFTIRSKQIEVSIAVKQIIKEFGSSLNVPRPYINVEDISIRNDLISQQHILMITLELINESMNEKLDSVLIESTKINSNIDIKVLIPPLVEDEYDMNDLIDIITLDFFTCLEYQSIIQLKSNEVPIAKLEQRIETEFIVSDLIPFIEISIPKISVPEESLAEIEFPFELNNICYYNKKFIKNFGPKSFTYPSVNRSVMTINSIIGDCLAATLIKSTETNAETSSNALLLNEVAIQQEIFNLSINSVLENLNNSSQDLFEDTIIEIVHDQMIINNIKEVEFDPSSILNFNKSFVLSTLYNYQIKSHNVEIARAVENCLRIIYEEFALQFPRIDISDLTRNNDYICQQEILEQTLIEVHKELELVLEYSIEEIMQVSYVENAIILIPPAVEQIFDLNDLINEIEFHVGQIQYDNHALTKYQNKEIPERRLEKFIDIEIEDYLINLLNEIAIVQIQIPEYRYPIIDFSFKFNDLIKLPKIEILLPNIITLSSIGTQYSIGIINTMLSESMIKTINLNKSFLDGLMFRDNACIANEILNNSISDAIEEISDIISNSVDDIIDRELLNEYIEGIGENIGFDTTLVQKICFSLNLFNKVPIDFQQTQFDPILLDFKINSLNIKSLRNYEPIKVKTQIPEYELLITNDDLINQIQANIIQHCILIKYSIIKDKACGKVNNQIVNTINKSLNQSVNCILASFKQINLDIIDYSIYDEIIEEAINSSVKSISLNIEIPPITNDILNNFIVLQEEDPKNIFMESIENSLCDISSLLNETFIKTLMNVYILNIIESIEIPKVEFSILINIPKVYCIYYKHEDMSKEITYYPMCSFNHLIKPPSINFMYFKIVIPKQEDRIYYDTDVDLFRPTISLNQLINFLLNDPIHQIELPQYNLLLIPFNPSIDCIVKKISCYNKNYSIDDLTIKFVHNVEYRPFLIEIPCIKILTIEVPQYTIPGWDLELKPFGFQIPSIQFNNIPHEKTIQTKVSICLRLCIDMNIKIDPIDNYQPKIETKKQELTDYKISVQNVTPVFELSSLLNYQLKELIEQPEFQFEEFDSQLRMKLNIGPLLHLLYHLPTPHRLNLNPSLNLIGNLKDIVFCSIWNDFNAINSARFNTYHHFNIKRLNYSLLVPPEEIAEEQTFESMKRVLSAQMSMNLRNSIKTSFQKNAGAVNSLHITNEKPRVHHFEPVFSLINRDVSISPLADLLMNPIPDAEDLEYYLDLTLIDIVRNMPRISIEPSRINILPNKIDINLNLLNININFDDLTFLQKYIIIRIKSQELEKELKYDYVIRDLVPKLIINLPNPNIDRLYEDLIENILYIPDMVSDDLFKQQAILTYNLFDYQISHIRNRITDLAINRTIGIFGNIINEMTKNLVIERLGLKPIEFTDIIDLEIDFLQIDISNLFNYVQRQLIKVDAPDIDIDLDSLEYEISFPRIEFSPHFQEPEELPNISSKYHVLPDIEYPDIQLLNIFERAIVPKPFIPKIEYNLRIEHITLNSINPLSCLRTLYLEIAFNQIKNTFVEKMDEVLKSCIGLALSAINKVDINSSHHRIENEAVYETVEDINILLSNNLSSIVEFESTKEQVEIDLELYFRDTPMFRELIPLLSHQKQALPLLQCDVSIKTGLQISVFDTKRIEPIIRFNENRMTDKLNEKVNRISIYPDFDLLNILPRLNYSHYHQSIPIQDLTINIPMQLSGFVTFYQFPRFIGTNNKFIDLADKLVIGEIDTNMRNELIATAGRIIKSNAFDCENISYPQEINVLNEAIEESISDVMNLLLISMDNQVSDFILAGTIKTDINDINEFNIGLQPISNLYQYVHSNVLNPECMIDNILDDQLFDFIDIHQLLLFEKMLTKDNPEDPLITMQLGLFKPDFKQSIQCIINFCNINSTPILSTTLENDTNLAQSIDESISKFAQHIFNNNSNILFNYNINIVRANILNSAVNQFLEDYYMILASDMEMLVKNYLIITDTFNIDIFETIFTTFDIQVQQLTRNLLDYYKEKINFDLPLSQFNLEFDFDIRSLLKVLPIIITRPQLPINQVSNIDLYIQDISLIMTSTFDQFIENIKYFHRQPIRSQQTPIIDFSFTGFSSLVKPLMCVIDNLFYKIDLSPMAINLAVLDTKSNLWGNLEQTIQIALINSIQQSFIPDSYTSFDVIDDSLPLVLKSISDSFDLLSYNLIDSIAKSDEVDIFIDIHVMKTVLTLSPLQSLCNFEHQSYKSKHVLPSFDLKINNFNPVLICEPIMHFSKEEQMKPIIIPQIQIIQYDLDLIPKSIVGINGYNQSVRKQLSIQDCLKNINSIIDSCFTCSVNQSISYLSIDFGKMLYVKVEEGKLDDAIDWCIDIIDDGFIHEISQMISLFFIADNINYSPSTMFESKDLNVMQNLLPLLYIKHKEFVEANDVEISIYPQFKMTISLDLLLDYIKTEPICLDPIPHHQECEIRFSFDFVHSCLHQSTNNAMFFNRVQIIRQHMPFIDNFVPDFQVLTKKSMNVSFFENINQKSTLMQMATNLSNSDINSVLYSFLEQTISVALINSMKTDLIQVSTLSTDILDDSVSLILRSISNSLDLLSSNLLRVNTMTNIHFSYPKLRLCINNDAINLLMIMEKSKSYQHCELSRFNLELISFYHAIDIQPLMLFKCINITCQNIPYIQIVPQMNEIISKNEIRVFVSKRNIFSQLSVSKSMKYIGMLLNSCIDFAVHQSLLNSTKQADKEIFHYEDFDDYIDEISYDCEFRFSLRDVLDPLNLFALKETNTIKYGHLYDVLPEFDIKLSIEPISNYIFSNIKFNKFDMLFDIPIVLDDVIQIPEFFYSYNEIMVHNKIPIIDFEFLYFYDLINIQIDLFSYIINQIPYTEARAEQLDINIDFIINFNNLLVINETTVPLYDFVPAISSDHDSLNIIVDIEEPKFIFDFEIRILRNYHFIENEMKMNDLFIQQDLVLFDLSLILFNSFPLNDYYAIKAPRNIHELIEEICFDHKEILGFVQTSKLIYFEINQKHDDNENKEILPVQLGFNIFVISTSLPNLYNLKTVDRTLNYNKFSLSTTIEFEVRSINVSKSLSNLLNISLSFYKNQTFDSVIEFSPLFDINLHQECLTAFIKNNERLIISGLPVDLYIEIPLQLPTVEINQIDLIKSTEKVTTNIEFEFSIQVEHDTLIRNIFGNFYIFSLQRSKEAVSNIAIGRYIQGFDYLLSSSLRNIIQININENEKKVSDLLISTGVDDIIDASAALFGTILSNEIDKMLYGIIDLLSIPLPKIEFDFDINIQELDDMIKPLTSFVKSASIDIKEKSNVFENELVVYDICSIRILNLLYYKAKICNDQDITFGLTIKLRKLSICMNDNVILLKQFLPSNQIYQGNIVYLFDFDLFSIPSLVDIVNIAYTDHLASLTQGICFNQEKILDKEKCILKNQTSQLVTNEIANIEEFNPKFSQKDVILPNVFIAYSPNQGNYVEITSKNVARIIYKKSSKNTKFIVSSSLNKSIKDSSIGNIDEILEGDIITAISKAMTAVFHNILHDLN